jgi:hypothetical protein
LVDHHWLIYGKEEKFISNFDKFGFVYLITNLKNGKGYIGCKQYLMYRKLKETESNWKTYMGSSKWLLKDIEEVGKEHFKFEIIAEYKNRRSLRYYELYYQMKFNVLSSTLEGIDEPAYYNSRVGGKFYRPVESYQDPEFRKKQSENAKKQFSDPEARKKLGKREYYKDPEYRKKRSEIAKKQWSDPEAKKKLESKTWGNLEYREKQLILLNKNRHVHTKRDPITGRFKKQNVQTK